MPSTIPVRPLRRPASPTCTRPHSGLLRRTVRAGAATLAAAVLHGGLTGPAAAQDYTPPDVREAMYREHLAMAEASRFDNLPWQHLGPLNVSGRMTDVDVVTPRDENYTIYVAGASGGVWRTGNEGVTWEPVLEDAISTSIGDVTIAPSDPDIIWVGTGEANIFRSSMAGGGVYRSTDGGETWEHRGLTGTHTIPRVLIHPTEPDIVYVASSGHEWTDNPERGVYKTTDGGESWEKVLYVDERTGAIDLVMDPRNPDRIYAATWERIRRKWNDPRVEEGYDGSGVWRTEDGGESWTEINDGLPAPEHRGRIGIDLARSNPDVLYAFVDNYEVARMPEPGETNAYGLPRAPVIKGATVYRTDDRGGSWRRVSEENDYMEGISNTYGWVFGQIRVDPNDENTIYLLGVQLHKSTDGARSFERLCCMHVDHHGLWIDPANSDYVVNVNDGGIDISYDGGENWRAFNDGELPLVQFFNVGVDMGDPFHAYGSIQDHGSRRGVVDLNRGRHRIPATDWEGAPGGEGSTHAIDPTDPTVVYSAGFYGRMSRTDLDGEGGDVIVPQPPEGELPYRGQWIAPFIISPHNPRILYLGLNHLFRSLDRGESWERISPDLTRNDPDRYGDIPFQTIYSIAEDPFDFGRLWVGTDDGRVWRTDDHGEAWTELGLELPRDRFIAEIVASAHEPGLVYLVQNGKRDDDFTPYVWMSTDHGDSWTDISSNVPSGPVNVIEEDPVNPDVLYLGTDLSAYVSVDRGASWHVLDESLPTTFVQDMVVHPRDNVLVAATHGRGMYAMDVTYLQQITDAVVASELHLFELHPVEAGGGGFGGGGSSAAVAFWMAGGAPGATVEVQDPSGQVVATAEAAAEPGLNYAVVGLPGGRGGLEEGLYTVSVSAGEHRVQGVLEVVR